jgi:hypothetical protein
LAGDGALSTEQLSSFLLAIVEEPGGGGRGATIAVVAVEPSSGDVLYDCFTDTPMRTELEVSLRGPHQKGGLRTPRSPQTTCPHPGSVHGPVELRWQQPRHPSQPRNEPMLMLR